MFTHQRQQLLLDHLAEQGSASVAALAARFGVSDDTIRRDLRALAGQGVLQQTHGGAIALDVPRMDRQPRARILGAVKQRLALAVAAAVRPGQTLMLDAGMTLLAVARALPEVPLTVITHSLDLANALCDRPRIRLVLAGGEWDARQRLFGGASAARAVAEHRADLAILGACAVHPDLGVTASGAADAEVKRAMLACAAQAWLVADHTKFGAHQPCFVAPLDAFHRLFTDRPVSFATPRPAVTVAAGSAKEQHHD